MKKQLIAVIATGIVELLFIRPWLDCKGLRDAFYFSLDKSKLILEDHIHTDGGIPLWFVRVVHNKVSVNAIELLRHYLHYWDVQFLVALLSPLGTFAFISGVWYLVEKKLHYLKKILVLLLLASVPLIEMLFMPRIPFEVRILLLATPYISLSVFGIWNFFKKVTRYRMIIFTALLLLSIWWFIVFQHELYRLCIGL